MMPKIVNIKIKLHAVFFNISTQQLSWEISFGVRNIRRFQIFTKPKKR